jgi:hypothetical protein
MRRRGEGKVEGKRWEGREERGGEVMLVDKRASSVAGPTIWNCPPEISRSAGSPNIFEWRFERYFNSVHKN